MTLRPEVCKGEDERENHIRYLGGHAVIAAQRIRRGSVAPSRTLSVMSHPGGPEYEAASRPNLLRALKQSAPPTSNIVEGNTPFPLAANMSIIVSISHLPRPHIFSSYFKPPCFQRTRP